MSGHKPQLRDLSPAYDAACDAFFEAVDAGASDAVLDALWEFACRKAGEIQHGVPRIIVSDRRPVSRRAVR